MNPDNTTLGKVSGYNDMEISNWFQPTAYYQLRKMWSMAR
jgi:hypothetical protein